MGVSVNSLNLLGLPNAESASFDGVNRLNDGGKLSKPRPCVRTLPLSCNMRVSCDLHHSHSIGSEASNKAGRLGASR